MRRKRQLLQLLLAEGKLTGFGVTLLFLMGLSILLASIAFSPTVWMWWLGISLGLGCMAVAGFSGRAHALGLPPPFTNDPLGWRKAKATYEKQSVAEDDASGKSRLERRGKD
jgi:hypothetical protein